MSSFSIKVMTYNICHGQGVDAQIDLTRQASVIKNINPDILFLQEVDIGTTRSFGIDECKALAELSGYDYFAFGKNIEYQGGDYGNAIFSKYPLNSVINHELPLIQSTKPEQRGLLEATVNIDGVEHKVFSTHFGMSDTERKASSEFIINLIEKYNCPIILGGDFNAGLKLVGVKKYEFAPHDSAEEILLLRSRLKDTLLESSSVSSKTFTSDNPVAHLDYIFYSGPYKVASYEIIDSQASDHKPVWVELVKVL